MIKSRKQMIGETGENEVIELINCPYCSKELMLLPNNYPLCDIQCTACYFRAQVKTASSKPKNVIPGASYNIIDSATKSGLMMPPLIVNFKWKENEKEKRKIILYPFIPKENMKDSIRKIKKKDGGIRKHRMFNYVNLDKLPSLTLFEE